MRGPCCCPLFLTWILSPTLGSIKIPLLLGLHVLDLKMFGLLGVILDLIYYTQCDVGLAEQQLAGSSNGKAVVRMNERALSNEYSVRTGSGLLSAGKPCHSAVKSWHSAVKSCH